MTGRMGLEERNRSDQIGRYDIGLDVADDVICIYARVCIVSYVDMFKGYLYSSCIVFVRPYHVN